MINKFKRYLEKEFRAIAPTQEAMDYREEILGTLLDKANELRVKGMTDEDLIFEVCIESLGDFSATLVEFESRREQLKKKAMGVGAVILSVLGAVLLLTIGYLAVSFVTKAWDKTWVIEVSGVLLGVIGGSILLMAKLGKAKKYLPLRLVAMVAETLIVVIAYLNVIVWTNINYSYFAFVALPIVLALVDMIISYLSGSKLTILSAIVFIQLALTLSYVMLGVAGVVAWGTFWLMPVFGAFVNICIVVTYFMINKKKNKTEVVSEKYYTTWKDE